MRTSACKGIALHVFKIVCVCVCRGGGGGGGDRGEGGEVEEGVMRGHLKSCDAAN